VKALVVAGGLVFGGSAVVDGVRSLREAGYDVTYVSWAGPSQALVDAVTSVVVLGPVPAGGEGQRPGPKPRSQVQRRLGQARTVLARQPSRLWSSIRRDPDVRAAAAAADLLVAVDLQALKAVWHLARQNPRPDAVLGLPAALVSASGRRA
jgi:hypothetical protein